MSEDSDICHDLTSVQVPSTDEEMAKEGLIALAKIALGPVGTRTRIQALNTLLSFTKAKPVSSVNVKVDSHEDWLKQAIADNEQSIQALKPTK